MSLRGVLSFELSWQAAAVTAACLFALAAIARLPRPSRLPGRPRLLAAAVVQELGALTALFALWRLAGEYSVLGTGDALDRGEWLWRAERVLHLPDEAAVQRIFLPHPLLVQGFNLFYAGLHFTALVAWLIWLFARHRDRYRQWRTTLALLTFGSLLVQLIPVAPPRMLSGAGLVDTAAQYGQSMYGTDAGFSPDQLSAMPSVHVGWALLIALAVVCVSRSRWRWLILMYPALTVLAVIVTANHFWLDGIASAALLALALLAQRAGRAALRHLAAAGRIPRLARSPAARPVAPPVVLPAPDRPRPEPSPAARGAGDGRQHISGQQHINGQPVNGQPVNGQPVNGQPVNGQRINGQVPLRPPSTGGPAGTGPGAAGPIQDDRGKELLPGE